MAWTIARALGDRLVLGAIGERFERGAIDARPGGRAFERPDPGVLVIGLRGDIEELGVVLDPLGRQGRCPGIGRVPRHRAQGLQIGQPADRVGPHALDRRGLRHGPDLLLIRERAERLCRSFGGLARRGDPREAAEHFLAQVRVRVASRDPGEHPHVVDARRGGAPHARVGVLRRERHEDGVVAFCRAELGHGREADLRIFGLVFGLDLEAVEERHREPYSIWKCGNVEMWKSKIRARSKVSTFPNFSISKSQTLVMLIQP